MFVEAGLGTEVGPNTGVDPGTEATREAAVHHCTIITARYTNSCTATAAGVAMLMA